jgi:hypothetical protein
MAAVWDQPAGGGDAGGNSLTPANPCSTTRGTHARDVPTGARNRLVFATGMGDGSARTTIRMQAEQGRDAIAAAERGRTTCDCHRMQY